MIYTGTEPSVPLVAVQDIDYLAHGPDSLDVEEAVLLGSRPDVLISLSKSLLRAELVDDCELIDRPL